MENWSQVEALLDEVADLDPEARRQYLGDLPPDQADLGRQLAEILEGEEPDERFREGLEPFLSEVVDPSEGSVTGQRLGPFVLRHELGRGGMGRVFAAVRADGQFEQDVAIKLLDAPLLGSEARERFHRERQILARLEHPGIARLIDGGVTESGAPYFAMELVDGSSITEHCDRNRLSIARRVRLFCDACRAVEAAHRNLVIHRDLKPSNILISSEGEVKLVDFGIAKVGDPQAGTLTQAGRVPVTPIYASPEQLRGEAATTASDLYSLGVVLHELLTGTLPFGAKPGELSGLARIADPAQTVPPASLGWARLPEERRAKAAVVRSASASEVARDLRRDLDAVLGKALFKEPGDRYGSVAALREDLERWLEGHPVVARGPSVRYRLSKWIGRHRLLSGVAAALALAVLVGAAGVWIQGQRAARERDRALSAEARSEAINRFLVDNFLAAAGPEVSRGQSRTLEQAVAESATRVGQQFEGQPEVEAGVRVAIGEVYRQLGDFEAALSHLQRAVRLLSTGDEVAPEELAGARLRLARTLLDLYRVKEADAEIEELLAGHRRQGTLDTVGALEIRALRGRARVQAGDRLAGELELEQVNARLAELHPEAWRQRLSVMQQLVATYQEQRKSVAAEGLARETLALQKEHLGEDHPDVANTLQTLGDALLRQVRFDEGRAALEEALALRERVLGLEHPGRVDTISSLARIHLRQGRRTEAERLFLEGAELAKRQLGELHPKTIRMFMNVAVARSNQGQFEVAEAAYLRARRQYLRVLGPTHADTLRSIRNLASLYRRWGKADRARDLSEELLRFERQAIQGETPDPTLLSDMANDLLRVRPTYLRDPELAMEASLRAVELSGRQSAEALQSLGRSHAALGELREALEITLEAARLPDGLYLYSVEREAVALFLDLGDRAGAKRFLEGHLERRRRARAPDDPLLGASLRQLGRLARDGGEWAEAEARLAEALQVYRQSYAPRHYARLFAEVELLEVRWRLQTGSVSRERVEHLFDTMRLLPESNGQERGRAGALLVELLRQEGLEAEATRLEKRIEVWLAQGDAIVWD